MRVELRRIYHHYEKWEEYHAGMWRKVPPVEESELLIKAIEFTGDHNLYGSWMMKVIKEWPISCEQNLTDNSMNRRAWTGHAAVCLAFGCPEYITRLAWWQLTDEQRDKANAQADKAIKKWEENYLLKKRSIQTNIFANLAEI